VVAFIGIISCYSYYSYLQEYLLADKSKKVNTAAVVGIQSLIAMTIAAVILKGSYQADLHECFTAGDF